MSDPWSRPVSDGASPPADGTIEIELDGPGEALPTQVAVGGTEPATEPNWRGIIGLSSLTGIVLGGIIAAVIFAGADDAAEMPTSTTLDPIGAASSITTPPTLPVVSPPTTPGTADTAPDDTALDGTALDDTASELALPDYPVVVGPDADVEPDQYVFDVSYLRASDLAIEATVTVAAGARNTDESVLVQFDVATNRYRLAPIGPDALGGAFVIDLDGGTTYTPLPGAPGADAWQALDNSQLADEDVALEEFLRAFLLGPVRPSTMEASTLDGGSTPSAERLVRLEDGSVVRPYIVEMPVSNLPEWRQLYGFGRAPEPADTSVTFRVLVGEDGRIRRIDGLNEVSGQVVLSSHSFELDDPVGIELPDPDLVRRSDPVETGDAESARPRYLDADDSSVDPPPLGTALAAFAAQPPTIIETTQIVGLPTASFRTERDPAGRLFQTIDDGDPATPTDAQFDDVVTGIGYVRSGVSPAPWDAGELGTEIRPIDPRFVDGLLGADELANGEVIARRRIVRDDGSTAVEHRLRIPVGVIADDTDLLGVVDPSAPFTVYVFTDDAGTRVVELHVLANQGLPLVGTQSFEYVERDEFTPPTVSS